MRSKVLAESIIMTHPNASRMKLAAMIMETSVFDQEYDNANKAGEDESSKLTAHIESWQEVFGANPELEANFKKCLPEYKNFGSFIYEL